MSSITSGVGLVSGLPIGELVESLIAAQRGPINILKNRVQTVSASRTAYLQLSAQLLSIRNAVSRLTATATFRATAASSSNETSLLATAGTTTPPGEYTFTVRNLASTHQLISSGFASSDHTPVGNGTITIESAAGRVDQSTPLALLNGGEGVRTGRLRITDKSGAQATVDLVTARTLDDVVRIINSTGDIQVRARVAGDRLEVLDESNGGGSLTIADIGSGRVAADLGIAGTTGAGQINGSRLLYLTDKTLLRHLNDGNGIRTARTGDDFEIDVGDGAPLRISLTPNLQNTTPLSLLNSGAGIPAGIIRITDRSGGVAEIDLSGAQNVNDVLNAVNNHADVDVTLSFSAGRFVLRDESVTGDDDPIGPLKVEDVSGGAGAALGITGESTTTDIKGKDVYFVDSVGDVLRLINAAPANAGRVTASISSDGLGITLTAAGGNAISVRALNGSRAGLDLGLVAGQGAYVGSVVASRRLVAGLNTVLLRSLNGGQGVDQSHLSLVDRAGTSVNVNIAAATTLTDVVDAINAAGTNIRAAVSTSGLGLTITDTTAAQDITGNLTVSGASAHALGIHKTVNASEFRGASLQRQYVSEATQLDDFNGGRGVPRGKFRITNSIGQSAVVDLTQGNERTIGDVLSEISSRLGDTISARINDTGDGIVVIDHAGGPHQLKIEEEGGTTARALNLLGAAKPGFEYIDGSFETRIDVGGSDSLDSVAEKIRLSGASVSVAVINDGSANRPYRLSLTGAQSGRAGALAVDGGLTGLDFETVAEARDATVVFGPADADRPLVFSTSGNTLTGAVAGLRLDLLKASTDPVTISVARNTSAIVNDVKAFVTAYNSAIKLLDDFTDFDPETFERGILQGDSTARRVRQTLTSLLSRVVPGVESSFDRFSSVGIRFESGGRIALNEDTLKEALDNDLDGVIELFTTNDTDGEGNVTRQGLGFIIQRELDRLTDTTSGTITLRDQSLQSSESQINRRIEQLEALLESRRQRLIEQFNATESIIAQLQSQQNALAGLSQLASFNIG